MMEQLDKWLFSEQRPDKIIEQYNLIDLLKNPEDGDKIKSLVSLELLLNKYNGPDESKNKYKVLRIIKDLRICKAHYKNLTKTYEKHDLTGIASREIYKQIMQDLEDFLIWLDQCCLDDLFKIE